MTTIVGERPLLWSLRLLCPAEERRRRDPRPSAVSGPESRRVPRRRPSQVSGLRWVFDGYTDATWDGVNGFRSGRSWARTGGVLIEMRDERDFWAAWSQPNGPGHRPNMDAYTGGIMWFDIGKLHRVREYGRTDAIKRARDLIAHEIVHQSGLGDLYNGTIAPGQGPAPEGVGTRDPPAQQDGLKPHVVGQGRPCRVRRPTAR